MNETATAEAGNPSRTAELREPLQRGAEQAIEKGKVLQDAAVEALSGSTAALKDQGSQLVEAAKDVAAEAGAKIEAEATRRKNAGADFVETFAEFDGSRGGRIRRGDAPRRHLYPQGGRAGEGGFRARSARAISIR